MRTATTVDLQAIAERLTARGIPARVEQTGGGVATIFVGTHDHEGRFDVEVGPGWFDGPGWTEPKAHREHLAIGPGRDPNRFTYAEKDWTDEDIVDCIVKYHEEERA
ncbi:MAG: hypothetical protein R3324_14485 [Halobacteriales archaeon]|nr:hypothetical protein [Halobacteriales archaeon]